MIRLKKTSTKTIVAIGSIWVIFLIAGVWYEMKQTRDLAIHEIKRWGVSSGENIRIAMNTLMREGKMDARFAFFHDLSNELSEINSVRVIRSPKVNEIFHRVRVERDIPREEESIRIYQEELVELQQRLDETRSPDEIGDIKNEIANINFDINSAKKRIKEFSKPMTIDPREAARDEIEKKVLKTGDPIFIINEDDMRFVSPYKVRKVGCAEASGCHFNAKEGEVLGAVDINFSLAGINNEVMSESFKNLVIKITASIIILVLLYITIKVIFLKKLKLLHQAIRNITKGDLDTRVSLGRRATDKDSIEKIHSDDDDEFEILFNGFNVMARKLEENQKKLENLANIDGLTALLNRRKFDDYLRDEISAHQKQSTLALLIIDIDNFKSVNDTYGHQTGDEALQLVSKIIKKHTRQNDITARYGGEEIAVILPHTTGQEAEKLAERIRMAVEKQAILNPSIDLLHLTVSIGVSSFPDDADTDVKLIAAADNAMYLAKQEGRNRIRRHHHTHAKTGAHLM